MSDKDLVEELSEDMEVIGPGQLLATARDKLGYTQEYVAQKLNFRHTLVIDIENERFDKSLPATFNRGYLKNYAKLVNLDESDVLASYEMLGVAETQSAEMQSFSKSTEKQAQNSLLMWISYLILAILIGSTLMYFLQDEPVIAADVELENQASNTATAVKADEKHTAEQEVAQATVSLNEQTPSQSEGSATSTENEPLANSAAEATSSQPLATEQVEPSSAVVTEPAETVTAEQAALADVVFNFSGDCWVNIYDAKGERVAWGVKKSGYEMKISALAPIVVTLGKPELVEISFNGAAVDMSGFNNGNIAKFTLPLVSNL